MSGEQLVYTIPQTAEMLVVSENTVYRLINDGALEPILVRSRWRIRHAALVRYLDAQQRAHRESRVRF